MSDNRKHVRRVVGHVSGWQELMPTCVCGKPWPCPENTPPPLAKLSADIIRNVCELPDYTSPDDQPDLVMCTVKELDACIERAVEANPVVATAPALLSLAERYASECGECGGRGFILIRDDDDERPDEDGITDTCEACADIRQVIATAKGGRT